MTYHKDKPVDIQTYIFHWFQRFLFRYHLVQLQPMVSYKNNFIFIGPVEADDLVSFTLGEYKSYFLHS